MSHFEQVLWGYGLTFPDDWIHRAFPKAEGFAAHLRGLAPDAAGPASGHILIQAEWNGRRRPVEPLWSAHIARFATMVGAKQVGASAWAMAGASGFEAEVAMPKKEEKRLWVGFLSREATVLKFMVVHPMQDRPWFEPAATGILTSLKFVDHTQGIQVHESGLPLPPDCRRIEPAVALNDISEPEKWRVFESPHSLGGLHAFYLREAPAHGWQIETFESISDETDSGFSRIRLRRGEKVIALGLLPYLPRPADETVLGRIAIKLS
jgi:hypothetical protein